MRLFFAIWPTDAERDRLWAAARTHCRGRGVARENLHVTLRFLGQVGDEAYRDLVELGVSIAAEPFDLVLDRVGVWPRAGVQWLSSSRPPAAMHELVAQFTEKLAELGFAPEARPYAPHLTIARKVRGKDPEKPIEPVTLRVTDFVLVESQTHASGAVYGPLHRWPLQP